MGVYTKIVIPVFLVFFFCLKISYVQKENQTNHPSLRETGNDNEKWRSDVIKKRAKLINVDWKDTNFWRIFFNRWLCKVKTAVDLTRPRNKNTLFIVLYHFWKVHTVFSDCLKCHFLISFSDDMWHGLVCLPFFGTQIIFRRKTSKKYFFKVDFKIFGVLLHTWHPGPVPELFKPSLQGTTEVIHTNNNDY